MPPILQLRLMASSEFGWFRFSLRIDYIKKAAIKAEGAEIEVPSVLPRQNGNHKWITFKKAGIKVVVFLPRSPKKEPIVSFRSIF